MFQINGTVFDKHGLERVEVYIEDSIIATINDFQNGQWNCSLDTNAHDFGTYTIKALAYDTSNNVGSDQVEIEIADIPFVYLENLPDLTSSEKNIDIEVKGVNITHYKYKLDSAEWSNEISITENIKREDLLNGVHTLEVIGKNSTVWQSEEYSTKFIWVVDYNICKGNYVISSEDGIYEIDANDDDTTVITSEDDWSKIENCKTITGKLRIYNTQHLNLSKLNKLESIAEDLQIFSNDGLTHLEGLNNLRYVGLYVGIFNNDDLSYLNGLNNLVYIGESLFVNNNDVLINLDGLNKLETVGTRFTISNNDILPTCEAENLLYKLVGFEGYSNIEGNDDEGICD